jgi:hypothetical protein
MVDLELGIVEVSVDGVGAIEGVEERVLIFSEYVTEQRARDNLALPNRAENRVRESEHLEFTAP